MRVGFLVGRRVGRGRRAEVAERAPRAIRVCGLMVGRLVGGLAASRDRSTVGWAPVACDRYNGIVLSCEA